MVRGLLDMALVTSLLGVLVFGGCLVALMTLEEVDRAVERHRGAGAFRSWELLGIYQVPTAGFAICVAMATVVLLIIGGMGV